RHELGRSPAGSEAGGLLLCLGVNRKKGSTAGLRDRLSGRTGFPVPWSLRRCHSQERRRKKAILSRAETNYRTGHRRLHDGIGLRRVRRKEQGNVGSRHAGRSRGARYGHHVRAPGKDSHHEGVAHRSRREDGLPSQVGNPSRTTWGQPPAAVRLSQAVVFLEACVSVLTKYCRALLGWRTERCPLGVLAEQAFSALLL